MGWLWFASSQECIFNSFHYSNSLSGRSRLSRRGASTIAEAAKTIIESNGGKCLLSTEVTRLIVEDNTVIGVEVQHKRGEKQVEIFEAPIVVSSTGALHSYSKLLKGFVPESYYADLKAIPKGKSAVTLYLGLKRSFWAWIQRREQLDLWILQSWRRSS